MKRLAQSKSANKAMVDNQYGKRWIDFPRAFLEIISNRIFLLAALGLSFDQIPITGFITFLPKYIQSQSGASLLTATTLTGTIATASTAIAQFGVRSKIYNIEIKSYKAEDIFDGDNIAKNFIH